MVNCMCQLADSGMPEWLGRCYFWVCLSVFPRGWTKHLLPRWVGCTRGDGPNRTERQGAGSWLCWAGMHAHLPCSGGGAPAAWSSDSGWDGCHGPPGLRLHRAHCGLQPPWSMSQVLTMNLFLYVSVLLVFLSGTLPNAKGQMASRAPDG